MGRRRWDVRFVKHRVPEGVHPMVQFVFRALNAHKHQISAVAEFAGVAWTTLAGWRHYRQPNLNTLESVLGALGYRLAVVPIDDPTPPVPPLPPEDRRMAKSQSKPRNVDDWSDERDLGNGIIVTLNWGWRFGHDTGEHIRGFDTVADARQACKDATRCPCPECKRNLALPKAERG